jgi:hypothetical protein
MDTNDTNARIYEWTVHQSVVAKWLFYWYHLYGLHIRMHIKKGAEGLASANMAEY